MADVTADINRTRAMRIAQRRVEGFAQEFGETHRLLARHAAFPMVLTPDLLYQIRANFVPEVPWVAVAHVLLSRLCRQVGYEIYEIDIADRNLLLRELKEEFGQERFDDLGEFLLDYVAQRLTDDDVDTQDLREAQEWTALAYTKPDEAACELISRIMELGEEEMGDAELLRLAPLVETLAEPLQEAGFEPLLLYSRQRRHLAVGGLKTEANQQSNIPEGTVESPPNTKTERLDSSQARYLALTARASNLELKGQYINQCRMSLAAVTSRLFNSGSAINSVLLQNRIEQLQLTDKKLELELKKIDSQHEMVKTEIAAVKRLIDETFRDETFRTVED